jgi:nicotinamide-nucleotide amidase
LSEFVLPEALTSLATRVIEANRAAGRRIAVAESCTGGLVSAALTEIPGSSDVFVAGIVTYADEAKMALLSVARDVLETFGAVSLATAWAMANGAVEKTGADLAVSITGIAGPSGGSERKPVGTVVVARSMRGEDPEKAKVDQRAFGDLGRSGIRLQAALCALELLMPDDAAAEAP